MKGVIEYVKSNSMCELSVSRLTATVHIWNSNRSCWKQSLVFKYPLLWQTDGADWAISKSHRRSKVRQKYLHFRKTLKRYILVADTGWQGVEVEAGL